MWRGGGAGPLESSTGVCHSSASVLPPSKPAEQPPRWMPCPFGACGDGHSSVACPVIGPFLKTGPAALRAVFTECRTNWKALWGLPRLPRRRGLCILVGFTRPLMSVASLLLENHRFAWGDGVCFGSWPRLWKRYGRESEKGVAHETYSDVGPVGPESAVRHGVRQNGRRHDDLV